VTDTAEILPHFGGQKQVDSSVTDFERVAGLTVPVDVCNTHAAEAAMQKLANVLGRLRSAAGETDTAPTEAQKESGRYRKGRFSWKGLTLVIETPKGAVRSGTAADGTKWSTTMKDHYGYVQGTESGADGDAVDVFISEAHPESELVHVVNQQKKEGGFDEHKCVLGCISLDEAKAAYLRNYSAGWTGMGPVAALTLDQFKWWLRNADTSKEVKNGYFAAVENRKPEKRGAADPTTGDSDFWARNEARKAEALSDPTEMIHIREGYIPCPGCKYRYHVMPDDNTCPKCGAELRTRLRGLSRHKSAFDVTPVMLFVKRADDDARPFTIAVDLDGTLAEQEEPFNRETIGKPREHAVEWTRLFHKAGARIIIFTVRGSTELVKAWLDENDVPYDYVNENPDQPPDSSGKVFADVYWDDRAFNAVDPNEHGPEILRRVVAHGGKDTDDPAAGPSPVITIRRETVVTITGPVLLAALEGEHEHEGDVGADDPAGPPDAGTGDRD